MENFINNSIYRPEIFLSSLAFWEIEIHGYPIVMMLWNFFLAAIALWLTYVIVQYLKKKDKNIVTLVGLFIFWLLMAPNTAYLLTETRHSLGTCPVEVYNHVCAPSAWTPIFFFLFAVTGWLSFIWTVRPIETALAKAYGEKTSFWFVVLSLLLLSLGVLLGLVNRFNSWEIVTNPLGIISNSFVYLLDLTSLQNYFMMTFLLSLLYLIGSRLIIRLPWERKTSKS